MCFKNLCVVRLPRLRDRDDSALFLAEIGRPSMSAKDHTFTLGIEEEFAIIDPETRELRSHIHEILEGGKIVLKEQIKPEMHQSVVELGTEVCDSIECARGHVIELRSRLAELAGRSGLKIASVGTHPFSHWRNQHITEGERYKQIIEDMQLLARANLIFGLHVHVGVPDREGAIHVMNQARYFLPHIYALSVNSPFWVGENTGLKGYRLKVFERFPRTGIPDSSTRESPNDFWASSRARSNAFSSSSALSTRRIPRPPPPAAALIITGNPSCSPWRTASSTVSTASPLQAATGTSACSARRLPSILSPSDRITSGSGPTNTIPSCSHNPRLGVLGDEPPPDPRSVRTGLVQRPLERFIVQVAAVQWVALVGLAHEQRVALGLGG